MKNVIEKYVPKMFGRKKDEYGELFSVVYEYELRSFEREAENFTKLNLSNEQIEGCVIMCLQGLLLEEHLERFRKKHVKKFVEELIENEN